jgi:hypothetical protein
MFLKILFVLQISYIQVYTDVYIEYEVGANDRHRLYRPADWIT